MWSDGLAAWFAVNGRHQLPWRLTVEPWPVLVSEVMLQQTSVVRVLPRWHNFLERWPSPAACAAAPLADVLREWQGLGYPRRARALWLSAARVSEGGWPDEEAGLRSLPGVGGYTARALLAFSELNPSGGHRPPRDVNIGRVAARAALGREPSEVAPSTLDTVLDDGRPRDMTVREYAYALFDVGSRHCRARPRCEGCPLQAGCAATSGDIETGPRDRRRPRYAGSLRQLRGLVLARALLSPEASPAELRAAVCGTVGASPERVSAAIEGLTHDGLITAAERARR